MRTSKCTGHLLTEVEGIRKGQIFKVKAYRVAAKKCEIRATL
jgi:hypothetical protein